MPVKQNFFNSTDIHAFGTVSVVGQHNAL